MQKPTMAHPKKWGAAFYMDENYFPYELIEGHFVELSPIKRPLDFTPKKYHTSECEVVVHEE
jgi:hypothetical protein